MLGLAIRGYFAALTAGNVTFWVTGLIRALVFDPHGGSDVGFVGFVIVFVLILIASFLLTFPPFIVLCAISLIFKIRNPAYFDLCGAAIGLLVTALVIRAGWTDWQMWARNSSLWQQLTLSGAVGGFVYWAIAVRSAVQFPALE